MYEPHIQIYEVYKATDSNVSTNPISPSYSYKFFFIGFERLYCTNMYYSLYVYQSTKGFSKLYGEGQ